VSIVNRRNAVVGWLALTVGKQYLRQKAGNRNRAAVATAAAAAVAAAVAGALVFWRRSGAADTDAE